MNKLRMIQWLLVAALLYALALTMLRAGYGGPLQTLTWKLGHVTMGGFAGYWLDRTAFRDRIVWDTQPLVMIRRAIIMFGAMYTLGAGM
ncbi:putative holin [Undibacterium sp.]|uniref:putative holin n=1 Tax=Undibacterium sp. TaxID=1914977 RepID=UPI002D0DB4EE|nr:putative holin [Undibacterium sp.]HTD05868.1 putative holin [Undibacterium sp.]